NYRGLDDLENLVNRPIIDLDIKDKRLEFYLRKLMIHNIQVWNNTSERKALEITEEQNRSINDEKPVITKDLITQIAVKTNPFLNDENETIPVGFDRFTTFQGQELRRKRDIWDPPITMNSRVINKILISKKND
ncbi:MAG: hypothetical protein KC550_07050, partial [Nanoarchaeota archaeon]|nr:hypothetical protein [Nanoarchaeota archaeon]